MIGLVDLNLILHPYLSQGYIDINIVGKIVGFKHPIRGFLELYSDDIGFVG